MGITDWWKNLRRGPDDDALHRAEEEQYESAEEREISSSTRASRAIDAAVARRAGEASMRDVDRLAE